MTNKTIEKIEKIKGHKNLPQGWVECIFEDVLEYEQPTKYLVNSTDYNDDYDIPVLTAGKSFILGYTNEQEGIFTEHPVIIFDDFTTASKFVDFKFKVKSSAMKILHANKHSNIKFLYYLMQTIQYKNDTHKRYWISEYAKQPFKMPPLAEQERIVDNIEELFSDIDDGVKTLEKTKLQIKQYRQSILESAFNGSLTNSNVENWKQETLDDILELLTDYHANGSYEKLKENVTLYDTESYAIMIRSTNFEKNDFTKDLKYIDRHAYEFLKKSQLFGGEILIGKIGNAGKVYYMPNLNRPVSLAMNMFALKFLANISSRYVYYYLFLNKSQKTIKRSIRGVGTPTIDKKSVKSIEIKYPLLDEQQKIVEEVEKRFEVADILEQAVDDGLEKAKQLKQSILKKAFEGKLVPQDPKDEPASILLEKIKIAKNVTKPKKEG